MEVTHFNPVFTLGDQKSLIRKPYIEANVLVIVIFKLYLITEVLHLNWKLSSVNMIILLCANNQTCSYEIVTRQYPIMILAELKLTFWTLNFLHLSSLYLKFVWDGNVIVHMSWVSYSCLFHFMLVCSQWCNDWIN